jgi:uncharacterized protein (DUF2147 family)
MYRLFLTFLGALALGIFSAASQPSTAIDANAILGKWQNAQKDAQFEIFQKGKLFYGKIIWGTGTDSVDVKNPNAQLRGRCLIGLVILNDFAYEGKGKWANGSIYDPKEGKTYSCKLTLSRPGTLEVRGYVGISLLGRTEVWTKIN